MNIQKNLSKIKTSIQYLKGVGPKKTKLLEKLELKTIEDVLLFLPRRYEDRANLTNISDLKPAILQTFSGNILVSGISCTKKGKKTFEVIIGDSTGTIKAKWFHFKEEYFKKRFNKNQKVIVSGTILFNNFYHNKKEIFHPEIEILDPERNEDFLNLGRIVPVYPTTEGIHQKELRHIIKTAVDNYADYSYENLPSNILKKENLIPITDAIRLSHFPKNGTSIHILNSFKSPQQRRLIFEEFLLLELGIAMKKKNIKRKNKKNHYVYKKNILNNFVKTLPFKLTNAQISTSKEILADLLKPYPMNRLLQGDVGSGKTIVAMISIILAIANGNQVAMMAPTEILAEQHYLSFSRFLKEFTGNIVLLTSSIKTKEKKKILKQIKEGEASIAIGTHAIIQSFVKFKNLSLIVIDEQHKFGVIQRANLKEKGYTPDILVMTATPIPRTLALTVYGDLNISVINMLPEGRKPVKTLIFYGRRKKEAFDLLLNEVNKGRQGYIIFPLIEESEKLDLQSAIKNFLYFKENIFPNKKLGLLHGRLTAEEKGLTMESFYNGNIDILIATTVIEVGVDVPNASVMLIANAERFGLSQLHQLRGRIGRGQHQSFCILLPEHPFSEDAKKRLQVIRNSADGFLISEKDLEIRGPGDFFGTKQSGLPELKLANILRDSLMLENARKTAFEIIEKDPFLSNIENKQLKSAVQEKWDKKLNLIEIG